MTARFPAFGKKGLGVGLDLPWDGKSGFSASPRGDRLAAGPRAFLERHAGRWSHVFFSWQPRDRSPARLDDYLAAWDDLFSVVPDVLPRALHHTALNLASLAPYQRDGLLAFTRALCDRYRLQWVNEDIGFWSVDGRAVPYPLPPLLTREGLQATVANVLECQQQLPVPLVIEFPGFSVGSSVVAGGMHAYDFFRALAEETDAPVTLDVGHLLSWQWWRGRRGEALLEELERLPLDHCFELHLSGCEIAGEAFIDAHHGLLLDEQLKLTQLLMKRCRNLRAITYEDPRFDAQGALAENNRPSWQRLQQVVEGWEGQAAEAPAQQVAYRVCARPNVEWGAQIEAALGNYLFGAEPRLSIDGLPAQGETGAVTAVHQMVLARRYRGTGGLRDWYPRTVAAWLALHPDDVGLERLVTQFCASAAGASWREHPNARRGLSLEEAVCRFFEAEGVGDATVREDEMLEAVVRTLAVAPRAGFVWPTQVWTTETGCVAVGRSLVLHAAAAGQYVRGQVTPLIVALLRGDDVAAVAAQFEIPFAEAELVHGHLRQRGFLAAKGLSDS